MNTNTTDLFVEIIIIGIGALIWLTLLIFICFGYSWIWVDPIELPSMFSSVITLVLFLAIAYVLGIIVDRVADRIFEIVKPRVKNKCYESEKIDPKKSVDYDNRRYIYERSEVLVDMLLYGRSRLRICRGWAFNAVLIWFFTNILFVTGQFGEIGDKPFIFSNIALIMLVSGLIYSWCELTYTDYRKVAQQSKWLRELHAQEGTIPSKNGLSGNRPSKSRSGKRRV